MIPLLRIYTYKLTEEIGNSAVGDIRKHGEKEESPRHWISESLFSLVQFEVLVSNTLLIDTNTGDGKDSVFLFQPACIKLTVWDNP